MEEKVERIYTEEGDNKLHNDKKKSEVEKKVDIQSC